MAKFIHFQNFFKENWLAILLAVFVGAIYLAPNVFFIASLGEAYQGIPMMQSSNEDFYLARIQEILDGHPGLGSFALYEGKDQLTLTPPFGEMFYALPSQFLSVSPVKVLIASRFFLPFALFLLAYFLVKRLTDSFPSKLSKLNAVAGALLVTLAYDLVDWRALWFFLAGRAEFSALAWARPVNPIIGAILLFSFLLCVWSLARSSRHRRVLIALAAVLFALMVGSYFFSWGLALSILAFLSLGYLLAKRWPLVADFAIILLGAALLSAPYWYNSSQLSRLPYYRDILLVNGLFFTHQPLWNKLLLAALLVYGLIVAWAFFRRKASNLWEEKLVEKAPKFRLRDWHLFCLAILLGGLWAFNQQILTGRTVWPFHFVQYTIPLVMVVMLAFFYNIFGQKQQKVWSAVLGIIIVFSLGLGIYTQWRAYRMEFDFFARLQPEGELFAWLNQQPKDCVVAVVNKPEGSYSLNDLIPAFTHCNVYSSTFAIFSATPHERIYNGYLLTLRLRGVGADEIEKYLMENRTEATSYLFSNWQELYNVKQFSNFSEPRLEERIKKILAEYRQFLSRDFKQELGQYRLDYILSVGPLAPGLRAELGLAEAKRFNDIYLYEF